MLQKGVSAVGLLRSLGKAAAKFEAPTMLERTGDDKGFTVLLSCPSALGTQVCEFLICTCQPASY
jgi:hypothetical protein